MPIDEDPERLGLAFLYKLPQEFRVVIHALPKGHRLSLIPDKKVDQATVFGSLAPRRCEAATRLMAIRALDIRQIG